MKKIMIFGTFDILHPGHFWLIKQALKEGEVHVCLALDETIVKVKDKPPVHDLETRKRQLEEFKVKVHPGDLKDKYKVFREIKPDLVILGYDQEVFVDGLKEVISKEGFQTEIKRLEAYKDNFFKSSKLRQVIEDKDSGFLLIHKPVGEASFKTVSALRKITGQKTIGFAGTLDPAASGLLVIGINKATKFLDLWHSLPKEYVAEISFGRTSTTYDSEGEITNVSSEEVNLQQIEDILPKFRGVIEQEPPMYSAKKVKGQKLYDLARKGEVIERKKDQIEIYDLEIIDYTYPVLDLRINCSTGTYIRSLAHDLGQELEIGAYLSKLERTAIGSYTVDQALTLDEVKNWQYQFIDFEKFLKLL